jgi:hypothetical protein
MKLWRKQNRPNIKIYNQKYRIRNPWLSHLYDARTRCGNKKNKEYHVYGGRGIKCFITAEEIKKLWFRDKAYKMKKPSIDRIDNDGHYKYNNCRFMELKENISKDQKSSVRQYTLQGNFIKEWESQSDAAKKLKISQGNICMTCLNKKSQAGGFIWRYK